MPIGIVLSGGGAKGDFELGAVRAMYNRGIRPAILSGTSVGSINAVKLAEGPTSDGALGELESIWFGLVNNDDMFLEDPNYARLDQTLKNFMRYGWFTIGYGLFTLTTSGVIGLLGDLGDAIRVGIDIGNLIDSVSNFMQGNSKSLYNLDPIRQKLTMKLNPALVKSSGAALRMAMVSLESGQLRYVNEQAQFIDDGTAVNLIQATIASASIPGIFPPQPLPVSASGQDENFIDGGVRDVLPIQAALDAGADQVYAICASRAGVDRAGSFDNSTIVDIALRATKDLMTDQIQSYETRPPGAGWPSSVVIIQPDFTVHDSFTIDPGLIRINSAYGYMRAAELVDFGKATDPLQQLRLIFLAILSTAISKLRTENWTMEYAAAGQRTLGQTVTDPQIVPVPSPEVFLQLRENKLKLKLLIEERLALYGTAPRIDVSPNALNFGTVPICGQKTMSITVKNLTDGGMPPGFSSWWLEFEAHPWTNLAAASPWSAFVSVAGTVPAATPPPPSISLDDLQVTSYLDVAGPFSVTGAGGISPLDIPANQSATIAVTMAPSDAQQPGRVNDILIIQSSDPQKPTLQVALTGEFANSPPILGLRPSGINFGTVLVNLTRTAIVTITNSGCGDLPVTALTVDDPASTGAFSVTSPALPLNVAEHTSVGIPVVFAPPWGRHFTATLQLTATINGAPVTDQVSLGGTGREPRPLNAPDMPGSLVKLALTQNTGNINAEAVTAGTSTQPSKSSKNVASAKPSAKGRRKRPRKKH